MRRERRGAREERSIGEGGALQKDSTSCACLVSRGKKEALQKGEGSSAQTAQAAHASPQEKALGTFHAFLYVYLTPALPWKLHGPSCQYFSLLSEHQEELKPTH